MFASPKIFPISGSKAVLCDGTTRLKSAGLPVSSHVSAWLFAKANGLSFSTVYCMEGWESSNVTLDFTADLQESASQEGFYFHHGLHTPRGAG